jgi:hypothetical protein
MAIITLLSCRFPGLCVSDCWRVDIGHKRWSAKICKCVDPNGCCGCVGVVLIRERTFGCCRSISTHSQDLHLYCCCPSSTDRDLFSGSCVVVGPAFECNLGFRALGVWPHWGTCERASSWASLFSLFWSLFWSFCYTSTYCDYSNVCSN